MARSIQVGDIIRLPTPTSTPTSTPPLTEGRTLGPKPKPDDDLIPHGQETFMHRMQTPVSPDDYVLRSNNNTLLRPLNCLNGDVCPGCGIDCVKDCCIEKGLSVNFLIKRPERFYMTHLLLYKSALKPIVIQCLKEEDQKLTNVQAEQEFERRFQSGDLVHPMIQFLGDHNRSLPLCAMRDLPPQGMRVYIDKKNSNECFHGLLQPLPGHDCTLKDFEDMAMAQGDGWLNCPYFVKANGNPDDIAFFDLPPPGALEVEVMVNALKCLLERWLDDFARVVPVPVDCEALLQLSSYIVTLCQEPEALVDLSKPPINRSVEPSLARFLLKAVKLDYINPVKRTYEIMVLMIANSLGMDASEVYNSHPFLSQDCNDEDKRPRTTVIYGNMTPFTISYGQGNDRGSLDQAAQRRLMNQELVNVRWDEFESLKQGTVVVKTVGNPRIGEKLPLAEAISARLLRKAPLRKTVVKMSLFELGEILAKQSVDSAHTFINEACATLDVQQLQKLLDSVETAQHPGTFRGRKQGIQKAAEIFKSQGTAHIASAAASVVVVIQSDPDKINQFKDVGEILQDETSSDFIVSYLSCLLRLKLAESPGADSRDYSLPLATRSLMTVSTERDDVDEDILTESLQTNPILPPMLHHPAYFTVFTLNREDVGQELGIFLALQVQEGIHHARAIKGLRSSFIVWFLDDRSPFDLSLAILRENGSFSRSDADKWARNVLRSGSTYFRKCSLEPLSFTELQARDEKAKRMMIITWNPSMHDLAVKCTKEIMNRSMVAYGSKVMCSLKMTRLNTDKTGVEEIPGDEQ